MRHCLPLIAALTSLIAQGLMGPAAAAAPGLIGYDQALAELRRLADRPGGAMRLDRIATTAENRTVWSATFPQAPAQAPAARRRPGMVLVFGQHPDEHDAVLLGLTLVRRIAEAPAADPMVARLRAACDLTIVPMANPDGTAYDLSTGGLSWRKNRRFLPTGAIGVNLNRNWDADFGLGGWVDPASPDYPGPRPFSEAETSAIRGLVSAGDVRVFVDWHTGDSSFSQGMVLLPGSSALRGAQRLGGAGLSAHRAAGEAFAARLTDPGDGRDGYVTLQSPQVADWLRAEIGRRVPDAQRARVLAGLPTTTGVEGAAIDWAAFSRPELLALAVEASRPSSPRDAAAFAAQAHADVARRLDRDLEALTALIGYAAE